MKKENYSRQQSNSQDSYDAIQGKMIKKSVSLKKEIMLRFGEITKQICYTHVQELRQSLNKLGINSFGHYEFNLNGKNKVTDLSQNMSGVLTITQKKLKYFKFNKILYQIWLSKTSNGAQIQKQIILKLKQEGQSIEKLNLTFEMKNEVIYQIEKLQKAEILYGRLQCIIVETYITIYIYYKEQEKHYQMKNSDTIYDLKKKIEKDYFPIEAQSLYYKNPEIILIKQEDNQKNLGQFMGGKNYQHIQLRETHTIEFYGFHENSVQSYDDHFSQFYVENQEEVIQFIKHSDFNDKSLESEFFNVFAKNCYSGIKKRFSIQSTIDMFKQIAAKQKSENLWTPFQEDRPITMNEQFVAMYLLYNSDQQLRIILMKLLGTQIPLPIYFRQFKNILRVKDQLIKNNQLGWVLKQGVTIISIGLHNEKTISKEKGKSSLINKLFFTNFADSGHKHKITKTIPYISINIYDQLYPLNIIDIPSDCPKYITQELFSFCNLVILHSWKLKEETEQQRKNIEQKYRIKVIVIHRDSKKSNQDTLKTLKAKKIIQLPFIQFHNIKDYEKSKSSIDLLRQKLHEFLSQMQSIRITKILKLSSNQNLRQLNNAIKQLFSFSNNQLIQYVQNRKMIDSYFMNQPKNLEKIQKQKFKPLNYSINSILLLIYQNKSVSVALDYFRQRLREHQNKLTSKFMNIYKYKAMLTHFDRDQNDFNDKILKIHEQLLNLPDKNIYCNDRHILFKPVEKIAKIFDQMALQFENKIRPHIFSMELFWREIYSFYQIMKIRDNSQEYNLNEIFRITVNLKTNQINNNQSFQIIDGDSLKMPKQIISQAFKPIDEKCLVITILGPQSSGKSTLLNFLFGCDFATSEGRCTRGVYGTLFRIKQRNINNFDGIFVIDTEGLFSLNNENDKQEHRESFDSKLVLFCLAISDFVIINVRGNFDLNTEIILRICSEKLEALNRSDKNKPEIIIVLNQNSTSKTEQSENQFRKIRQTFDFRIAKSLSMAYFVTNYSKKEISILNQSQILTKKKPLPQFRKETSDLLKHIIVCMKKKKTAQKILDRIEKFQLNWTTVLAFPNLSSTKTKEYSELEKDIKIWRKQQEQQNTQKFQQILANINNQKINQVQAQKKIEQLNESYVLNFRKNFNTEQKKDKQILFLIQSMERQIKQHNFLKLKKLQYGIKQINYKKQINIQKFKGDQMLRQQENKIINNQNLGIKQYTDAQKQKIFNRCFFKKIQLITKSMNLSKKYESQKQRIRDQYQLLIKTKKSSMQALGLMKQREDMQVQQFVQNDLSKIQIKLKNIFINPKKADQFIYYNGNPHTNILKGSNSDAKLKYFNARDYFKSSEKYELYMISKNLLGQAFRKQKLILEYQKLINKLQQQGEQTKQLKECYEKINRFLKNFRLQIPKFSNFCEFYKKKQSGYLALFLNLFKSPSNQIQLQVEEIKSQHKYFKAQEICELKKKIKQNNQLISIDIDQFFLKCETYYQLKFRLGPKIQRSIKWKKIREFLQNNKKFSINGKQRINQLTRASDIIINKEINKDLKLCNLKMDDSFYLSDILKSLKESNIIGQHILKETLITYIRPINQEIIYTTKQFQDIRRNWGTLKYFNSRILSENIKCQLQQCHNHLVIGIVKDKQLVPIQQYFQSYNEGNALFLKQKFRSRQFRDFIFQQLINNGSIDKLSEFIFNTIKQCFHEWGRFQSKSISQIFNKVNEEITRFNNDLNQVSYQMTPTTMGKIHQMTIYTIWKYEADEITKKQNQIYNKIMNSRDDQFKKFTMRTSNNINDLIQEEVGAFQNQIIQQFQYQVLRKKQQLYSDEKLCFMKAYNRKQILDEIDGDIFQKDTDSDIVLQYLQNPINMISCKYNEKYEECWTNIAKKMKNSNYSSHIFKDLRDFFEEISSDLKQTYQINDQSGTARDIFQMAKGEATHNNYDEKAKKVLFAFFIDIMLDENPQKERECMDLKLKPKINLHKSYKLKNNISNYIISKLVDKEMKITNLPKFISLFLTEGFLQSFKARLNKIYSFSDQQRTSFLNQIRAIICPQKCPCCGRICGIQETHTFHQCLYGHQMRALAGNHIKRDDGKKEAFVQRCEQINQTDIMEYNGHKYTWTQFKQYWKNKPVGGWLYEDTMQILDKNCQKRFTNAWQKAGPIYCQNNGLQFVYYNDLSKTKQDCHFIFALDESSSMRGKKWQNLMRSFQIIIKKIESYNKMGHNCFVTIINFSNVCQVIYERVKPQQVRCQDIPYNKRIGTQFNQTFMKVAEIASATIKKEVIVYIFMTDGYAEYPSEGIDQLKQLDKQNPKRFIYSGIQYGSSRPVMKYISKALKGSNIIANTFDELIQAYTKAIQVIAYKEIA